jgi:hypothetical protein
MVASGNALERIGGAQERLAATAEESTRLLHSLMGQVDWQECLLPGLGSDSRSVHCARDRGGCSRGEDASAASLGY